MSGIMDKWKALAVPRKEFMELIRGCEGWAGVDMSKRIDLTAAAHVFWLPDGRLAVTAHGFMPEETTTKHEHTDRVPYKHWAKEGWCTLTPGAVTDYKYIANYLAVIIYNFVHILDIDEFVISGIIPEFLGDEFYQYLSFFVRKLLKTGVRITPPVNDNAGIVGAGVMVFNNTVMDRVLSEGC